MKIRQEVYATYWYVAAERQNIFFNKLYGSVTLQRPPTQDPIFQNYKFCNTYRASDRVSQYLIRNVIYPSDLKISHYAPTDILFRIFLFRLLNKNETWDLLESRLGEVSLKNFSFDVYDKVLEDIKIENQTIYGNAFILCANKIFGYEKKHQNHLALLESIFKTNVATKILASTSLEELFLNLRSLPLIGDFMAYQLAIDLNYSELFDFSENDFTTAGPGARRGIRKCFEDLEGKSEAYVIQSMVENQDKEFERLGLKFQDLFGRKLHAIDCQGLFCETDKYSRAKFPELKSNRKQIKAKYKPSGKPIEYFYPPKWKLHVA